MTVRTSEQRASRIVFVSTGFTFGGAETQLIRVLVGLRARGWNVEAISLLPPDAGQEELRAGHVRLHVLGMKRGVPDPRALGRALTIVRSPHTDCVVSFQFHANLLARLTARLAGVADVVSSIRNEYFGGTHRDWAMHVTDWMAHATVTNSFRAAEALATRRVVRPDRLVVIPNGLDTQHYAPRAHQRTAARSALGVSAREFVWIAIGRLEAQKRFDRLLEAFVTVREKLPSSRLFICGRGEEMGALCELARTRDLVSSVCFLSVRPDVRPLLAAADALVLSSDYEGLPNVLLEGHASALPIVSTNVGGVSEIVVAGRSGILTDRSASSLAEAMVSLAEKTPEERHLMGMLGRDHVIKNFEMSKVIQAWEDLLTTRLPVPLIRDAGV